MRGRRAAHLRHSRRGRYPVPIWALVSPLRYDVVVRAQFFDMVAAADDPDSPEFVALAAASPYGAWFRLIAVPRFHPRLVGDQLRIEAAFRARVTSAVALWRAFEANGWDERHPILLRRAVPGARTTMGQMVERPLYLADGCHRLALLLRAGHVYLQPEQHRVDSRRLRVLPDNTSVLMQAFDVAPEARAAFLSMSAG
jgi:hypothetical protein